MKVKWERYPDSETDDTGTKWQAFFNNDKFNEATVGNGANYNNPRLNEFTWWCFIHNVNYDNGDDKIILYKTTDSEKKAKNIVENFVKNY